MTIHNPRALSQTGADDSIASWVQRHAAAGMDPGREEVTIILTRAQPDNR